MENNENESLPKLQNFLVRKLADPDFFKACLNSKKTIKDPLKKWGMFSDEEILEYLGGPKHVRGYKCLFRVLYNYRKK